MTIDLLIGLFLGLILILLLIEWLALMLWLLDLLGLPVRSGMVDAFLSVFDSVTPFIWISPFCSGELSSCAITLGTPPFS